MQQKRALESSQGGLEQWTISSSSKDLEKEMEQISLLPKERPVITEYGTLDDLLSNMPANEEIYNSAWKCWYMVQDHQKIMCSVSGGYDSDIMLDLLIRCGGRSKTTFIFNNTGLEYAATKEHIKQLETRYGVEIVLLRPKKAIPTCCREYGVPFWSKYVSGMISRLQKHGFQWENEPLDALLEKYPRCRSALRWWCNDFKTKSGRVSKFNIEYARGLKEFMIIHPPGFRVSAACCQWAKKMPAHDYLEAHKFGLNCTGIRRAEGGARSTSYTSCYDENWGKADNYRPLFWWSDADKEVYRKRFGIVRSDCYEVWGMQRTGCAGCPFGKNFEEELELVQQFEPKQYRAMQAVFGQSYEYTRRFFDFRRKSKNKISDDREQTKMKGFE